MENKVYFHLPGLFVFQRYIRMCYTYIEMKEKSLMIGWR